MTSIKMHADEVDIDSNLVRRLIRSQFPEWADLKVVSVPFRGTDNALYRLGSDLDSRNVLAKEGRLTAVIDFGCLGVGDPACDVMVAWKMFSARSRDTFLTALSVDEATRARARGWVLSQALIALAYYTMETNPVLVRESHRWIAEVLS